MRIYYFKMIAHKIRMGLGKTLSTCTFIILYFEHVMKKYSVDEYKEKYGVHPATALIVTPKSTLENWAKEIRMWEQKATDLKPLSHNSSNKKDSDEGFIFSKSNIHSYQRAIPKKISVITPTKPKPTTTKRLLKRSQSTFLLMSLPLNNENECLLTGLKMAASYSSAIQCTLVSSAKWTLKTYICRFLHFPTYLEQLQTYRFFSKIA